MDAGFDAARAAEDRVLKHGSMQVKEASIGVCDRRMRVCRKVANLRQNLAILQGAAALPPKRKNRASFFYLRTIFAFAGLISILKIAGRVGPAIFFNRFRFPRRSRCRYIP